MRTTIPIISDSYTAKELQSLLQTTPSDIQFELQSDEQTVRSVMNDPTVVVALITAGATTLAALIALFGVVWSTRQKEKKKDNEISIEIKITTSGMESIHNMGQAKKAILQQLFEGGDFASEKLHLSDIEAVTTNQNYDDILNEIMMEEVEYVSILGDE